MPTYINKDKMSENELESLRLFAVAISDAIKNGNDLSEMVSNYILKGKIINPNDKNEIMSVPGLPKKDTKPQNSLINIKKYFEELFDTYMFDQKAKDTVNNLDNNFKVQFALRVLKNNFTPNQEIMGMKIEMSNDSNAIYENYIAYSRVYAVHESRPKPKWYEFGKRFSLWQEGRQLEKFEKLLLAKGVKAEDIAGAKQFNPTREESFKTKPCLYSQLKKINSELNMAHLHVSEYDPKEKASSKKGQEFLKHAMKAYELINDYKNVTPDPNNKYEKKLYEDIKFLQNDFDEMVSDRIKFDNTSLEELKEKSNVKGQINKNIKNVERINVKFEKEVFSEDEVEFNLEKPLEDIPELDNEIENSI